MTGRLITNCQGPCVKAGVESKVLLYTYMWYNVCGWGSTFQDSDGFAVFVMLSHMAAEQCGGIGKLFSTHLRSARLNRLTEKVDHLNQKKSCSPAYSAAAATTA